MRPLRPKLEISQKQNEEYIIWINISGTSASNTMNYEINTTVERKFDPRDSPAFARLVLVAISSSLIQRQPAPTSMEIEAVVQDVEDSLLHLIIISSDDN
jgi:hypothetical protein